MMKSPPSIKPTRRLLLLHLLSLISLAAIPSESAFFTIDLSSEWMEVIVVNLKPGHASISIAINEMSKHKSLPLVAFHIKTSLLNEEAAGIAARYPEKVFSHVRDMIGKPFSYAKSLIDSLDLPFDLVEYLKGGAQNRVADDGGGAVYPVEDLVTMVLKYGIHLAKFYAKVGIKDVVITMPPYFGQTEWRGLLLEGQLVDINMLSLINEHFGTAHQYGIDKNFSNESRQVIFYNMGVRITYVGFVYFWPTLQ